MGPVQVYLLAFIFLLLVPFSLSLGGGVHFSEPNLSLVFSPTDSFFVISLPSNPAFSSSPPSVRLNRVLADIVTLPACL